LFPLLRNHVWDTIYGRFKFKTTPGARRSTISNSWWAPWRD
jgi:hypothetical protein